MQNNETKKCILYDNRFCTHCGECDMCDLDPSKVCDNCEKCLHAEDNDYNVLELDMHLETEDESILDDPELLRKMDSSEDDWLADFYTNDDKYYNDGFSDPEDYYDEDDDFRFEDADEYYNDYDE